MIRGKKKKILLFLSLLILVIGFLFVFFPSHVEQKSVDKAYEIIPASVELVVEVHNAPDLYLASHLLLGESLHNSSKFTDALCHMLEYASSSLSPFLILSNSKEDLDDGFLILTATQSNTEWIKSYLNAVEQLNQPYRKVEYRGYHIQLYSLALGTFFSLVNVDGYLIASNQISNLYAVIDTFIEPVKVSKSIFTSDNSNSKAAIATLYSKEFFEKTSNSSPFWTTSYLMRENQKTSILQKVDEKDVLTFSNGNANGEYLSREVLKYIPKHTFSIAHYTQVQLMANYEKYKDNLLLSPSEEEWYDVSLPLIEHGFLNGIYGYRIYDSVVSSNLILKSVDSLSILKDLERNNSKLMRRLLREETIYYSPMVYAIPSPKWLNELFEVSRDQRVLYIGQVASGVLISWDFNLLITCLAQFESPEKLLGNDFDGGVLSAQHYFYIGDLLEVKRDTLVEHLQIPLLIKKRIDHLSSFYFIDEFISSAGSSYRMRSLKLKD